MRSKNFCQPKLICIERKDDIQGKLICIKSIVFLNRCLSWKCLGLLSIHLFIFDGTIGEQFLNIIKLNCIPGWICLKWTWNQIKRWFCILCCHSFENRYDLEANMLAATANNYSYTIKAYVFDISIIWCKTKWLKRKENAFCVGKRYIHFIQLNSTPSLFKLHLDEDYRSTSISLLLISDLKKRTVIIRYSLFSNLTWISSI